MCQPMLHTELSSLRLMMTIRFETRTLEAHPSPARVCAPYQRAATQQGATTAIGRSQTQDLATRQGEVKPRESLSRPADARTICLVVTGVGALLPR